MNKPEKPIASIIDEFQLTEKADHKRALSVNQAMEH